MHNNIFSIDDNRVTQMLSQKIFSRTAFTKKYLPFINGVKAIGYFYQLNEMDTTPDKIPAVIFTNFNMPVFGGWQFPEKKEEDFLHLYPDIKVVISSSSLDPNGKMQADDHPNVVAFLKKPLTPDMVNSLKTLS